MLVSPDMRARYVASTMNAIEEELRAPDCDLEAIALLMAGVARIALELAVDTGAYKAPHANTESSNVIPFRRFD
jgi:hypothetical protein